MSAPNPPDRQAGNQTARPDRSTGPTTSAKTSAAATFALVFGVSGLLSALTVLLSTVGLILGLIGIILAIVALKMTRRPGVTGRGVAIGGLVLSILAVLLALAFAIGITTFLNDEGAVDRLQRQVEDLREDLPT